MTVIRIDDTYRVEIRSYDFELIKHVEPTTDSKERDITLGYFPSLKHALAWLKREKLKSIGNASIDKYIDELRKMENWTGDILDEQTKHKA